MSGSGTLHDRVLRGRFADVVRVRKPYLAQAIVDYKKGLRESRTLGIEAIVDCKKKGLWESRTLGD